MTEDKDKCDYVEYLRVLRKKYENASDVLDRLDEECGILLEKCLNFVNVSIASGVRPRDVAASLSEKAASSGINAYLSTNVVYVIFSKDSSVDYLYVGETVRTCAQRWKTHPYGCPILLDKIGTDKDGWECLPIFKLPEHLRSKRNLVSIETEFQKALKTVGTPHGMNCHFGDMFSDADFMGKNWELNFSSYIDFVLMEGRDPSKRSKDCTESALGSWLNNQRSSRESMPTANREALENIPFWRWRTCEISVCARDVIEKLLEHPVVEESNGWIVPTKGYAFGQRAIQLRRSYLGKGKEYVLFESDRRLIEERLPGLTVSGYDAKFLDYATQFSKKYPSSSDPPRQRTDSKSYTWLYYIRNRRGMLTEKRREILISVGLGWVVDSV